MSGNYKCGQFDDSFHPTRLRNWNKCARCVPRCCKRVEQFRQPGHLSFIADDRGHLLPEVKACMNPPPRPQWGPKVLSIWDESPWGCQCGRGGLGRGPLPETKVHWNEIPKYYKDRPPIKCTHIPKCMPAQICLPKPKKRPRPPPPPISPPWIPPTPPTEVEEEEEEVVEQPDIIEVAFTEFKPYKIPVLWIVGYMSDIVTPTRMAFVAHLARRLGFAYIDLDKEISRWIELIENGFHRPEDDPNNLEDTLLNEYLQLRHEDHDFEPLEDGEKETELLFKANDFHGIGAASQGNLVMDASNSRLKYDDEELERFAKISKFGYYTRQPTGLPPLTFEPEVARECIKRCCDIAQKMHDSPEIRLSKFGIVQLLKMVMLITYPTKGYIIDQFPVNIDEAMEFENQIWPPVCAIYFVYYLDGKDEQRVLDFNEPIYFRREEEYEELKTDAFVERFGMSGRVLKVLQGDPINDAEVTEVNCLVDAYLGKTSCQALLAALRVRTLPRKVSEEIPEEEPIEEEEPEEEPPEEESPEEEPEEEPIQEPIKVPSEPVIVPKPEPEPPEYDYEEPAPDDSKARIAWEAANGKEAFQPPTEIQYSHYLDSVDRVSKLAKALEPPKSKKLKNTLAKSLFGKDNDNDAEEEEDKEDEFVPPEVIQGLEYGWDATEYVPEPVAPPGTLQTLFPPLNPQSRIIPSKDATLKSAAHDRFLRPQRTGRRKFATAQEELQVELDAKLQVDLSWMDREDDAKKKTLIPFLCCFDQAKKKKKKKKKKGEVTPPRAPGNYWDLAKPVEPVPEEPEPPKVPFKQKLRKIFASCLEPEDITKQAGMSAKQALKKYDDEQKEKARLKALDDAEDLKTIGAFDKKFAETKSLRPRNNAVRISATLPEVMEKNSLDSI